MAIRVVGWVVVLAALLFPGSPANAETEASIFRSPHLDHTSLITGVGFAHYNAWNPGFDEEPAEQVGAPGVRGFLEINAIEHILEIELSAAGFWDGNKRFVTLDLLAKRSFEFERFNPYVGIGPSLSIDILEEETTTAVGATLGAGGYYWLTDHIGVDVDVAYSLISRGPSTGQELVIAVGPVVRF